MEDELIMESFRDTMNQDFNIPNVMTLIYDVPLKQMNKETQIHRLGILYKTVKTILEILGIMPLFSLKDDVLIMYRQWEEGQIRKKIFISRSIKRPIK